MTRKTKLMKERGEGIEVLTADSEGEITTEACTLNPKLYAQQRMEGERELQKMMLEKQRKKL